MSHSQRWDRVANLAHGKLLLADSRSPGLTPPRFAVNRPFLRQLGFPSGRMILCGVRWCGRPPKPQLLYPAAVGLFDRDGVVVEA
jgi:hypothetical protein